MTIIRCGAPSQGRPNRRKHDRSNTVNSFLKAMTKGGTYFRFKSKAGQTGEIYETTSNEITYEFRRSSGKKHGSAKRRKYKIYFRHWVNQTPYEDTFTLPTSGSYGTNYIDEIQILEKVIEQGNEQLTSENPAIWETEPKEAVDLDLYYDIGLETLDLKTLNKLKVKSGKIIIDKLLGTLTGKKIGLTTVPTSKHVDFNYSTCFEVLEHVEPIKAIAILDHLPKFLSENSVSWFSTPCWDEKVGAAANHVNEMTYKAFGSLLEEMGYKILKHWGTFASIKDYKKIKKSIKDINENIVIGVQGGSQGSNEINNFVYKYLENHKLIKVKILHIVGPSNIDKSKNFNNYEQLEYVDNMNDFYQQIDVQISRAGGGILEALYLNIPLILIPYKLGTTSSHQQMNAKFLVDNEYAIICNNYTDVEKEILLIDNENTAWLDKYKVNNTIESGNISITKKIIQEIKNGL